MRWIVFIWQAPTCISIPLWLTWERGIAMLQLKFILYLLLSKTEWHVPILTYSSTWPSWELIKQWVTVWVIYLALVPVSSLPPSTQAFSAVLQPNAAVLPFLEQNIENKKSLTRMFRKQNYNTSLRYVWLCSQHNCCFLQY